MRARRPTPSGTRGASILELALVTPVLAMLVLGTLDATQCYRTQIRLENAAREGGAYAQVHPADVVCPDEQDIVERVLGEDEELSALTGFVVEVWRDDAAGDPTVPITGCGEPGAKAGERIRVEVSATHVVATPLVKRFLGSQLTVTGSYEVVVHG